MKQFTVNRFILIISWFLLLMWVFHAGLLIVLLAMGSPLWIFALAGISFLFFWVVIAATYPKTIIISDESIAFQLPGSDKIQTFSINELEISSKQGYYELAVAGAKKRKKFLVSKREVPSELEKLLQSLSS